MDYKLMWDQIVEWLNSYGLHVLAALGILVGGWIVALVVSWCVRWMLHRTTLDNKLASWLVGEDKKKDFPIEKWISKAVFYLLMVVVLIAFFHTIKLTPIANAGNALLTQIMEYAPRLLGAAILLLVAWILASLLKMIIIKALAAIKLDERFGSQAGVEGEKVVPVSKTIADAVYWLVFLFFLPAILGALDIEGLLDPVQGMINKILDYLPNLFATALILAVGWFVARILQRIVASLTSAVGVDALSEKVGMTGVLGKQKLSGLLGLIVYVLVFIPVLVAALNALKLDAITKPASDMLSTLLGALPNIFAAFLVLLIAFLVGRIVSGLIANLLAGLGFNGIFVKLGLSKEEIKEGQKTPASIVGYLVLVGVMLFATIEAARLLGFALLADLVSQFIVFSGKVLLGVVIFGVGLFLATLASKAIQASSAKQARFLSLAAQVAILILAGAMALRQMGLASDIINMAFGLLLGAVAIAAAIAFGIGGREIAARELEGWIKAFRKEE